MGPVTAHPLDRPLADLLPAGSLYAVGGRVRDEFRALIDASVAPPKDLDYVVVGLTLEDVLARIDAIGSVNVVGASFSVIKLATEYGSVDIALPRRERSTGSGHREFTVESGPHITLEDDLGRRDFRMNMIARRIGDDVIVDPFGGVADIRAGRIEIVTPVAFEEDPLRMLRAAQFAARFGYALGPQADAAMRAAAPLVRTVSAERVCDELTKLFEKAVRPSVGVEILRTAGVLAELWPEILEGEGVDQNEWHAYDVYRHNLETLDATPPDLTLRLAAILHDVGKPRTKDGPHFYQHEHVGADMAAAMLERFRFPGEIVATVEHLVRQHMYAADPEAQPKAIRRFINRIGPERLDQLFALRHADIVGSGLPKRSDDNERFQARVAEILAESPPFTVRDLAITGGDVIDLMIARGAATPGFRGDRRVGELLAALFEEVVDDPTRNERIRLVDRAQHYIDERFSH
jgi:putative nucleotidyltransferase with HDIG domain